MKKTSKLVLFALMLALAVLGMSACGKTKVNVADGITVSFWGVDGHGHATILYDEDDPDEFTPKFVYDLMTSGKISADNWEALIALSNAISYELDNPSDLSNGDTVTVVIDVNEAIFESLGLSAKSMELQFTVEGLEEVEEIDAFEDFEIVYEGVSPEARTSQTVRQEMGDVTITYTLSSNTYLKNGDVITVTASIPEGTRYELKEDTKTFTVSGVDEYLQDGSKLTDEVLKEMRQVTDEAMNQMVNKWQSGWNDGNDYYTFDAPQYVGYEFMCSPNCNENLVFMGYKTPVGGEFGGYDTYFWFEFRNVIVKADGTMEVDADDVIYSSSRNTMELSFYNDLKTSLQYARPHRAENYTVEDFF